MKYMILDSLGNAVAALDNEATARATLHSIVRVEPEAADHVVLVEYGDDGLPVGDPVTFYDAPPSITLRETEFVLCRSTTAVVRRVSKEQRHYLPGVLPAWNRWSDPAESAQAH